MRSHPQSIITYYNAGLPEIWAIWDNDDLYVQKHAEGAARPLGPVIKGGYFDNRGVSDGARTSFYASRCNPIYGRSPTVQPPAVALNFYIRAR